MSTYEQEKNRPFSDQVPLNLATLSGIIESADTVLAHLGMGFESATSSQVINRLLVLQREAIEERNWDRINDLAQALDRLRTNVRVLKLTTIPMPVVRT